MKGYGFPDRVIEILLNLFKIYQEGKAFGAYNGVIEKVS
jgi:hypothetical protein